MRLKTTWDVFLYQIVYVINWTILFLQQYVRGNPLDVSKLNQFDIDLTYV